MFKYEWKLFSKAKNNLKHIIEVFFAVSGIENESMGYVATLYRRCGRENETPTHVLRECLHNMLLVARRHQNV